MEINLERIEPFLQIALVFIGAFLAASVISIVVWTARDIRSRSRDIFVQFLSILLVLVFNLPGLLLYFILRPRETLADSYERLLEEETLLQELEGRQACPYCHLRVEDDFLFCPGCHAQLRKTCLNCGRLMHLRWDLCPYCGYEEAPEDEEVELRPVAHTPAVDVPKRPAPTALTGQPDTTADEETLAAFEAQGSPEEVATGLREAASAGSPGGALTGDAARVTPEVEGTWAADETARPSEDTQ